MSRRTGIAGGHGEQESTRFADFGQFYLGADSEFVWLYAPIPARAVFCFQFHYQTIFHCPVLSHIDNCVYFHMFYLLLLLHDISEMVPYVLARLFLNMLLLFHWSSMCNYDFLLLPCCFTFLIAFRFLSICRRAAFA